MNKTPNGTKYSMKNHEESTKGTYKGDLSPKKPSSQKTNQQSKGVQLIG